MSSGPAPAFEIDTVCASCGQYGAYAFDGQDLCVSCYQERGSSCAGSDCDVTEPSLDSAAPTPADETHRVNPNCCYSACPRCASIRRLREFQARHPGDWRSRLRGLERLVRIAQTRD